MGLFQNQTRAGYSVAGCCLHRLFYGNAGTKTGKKFSTISPTSKAKINLKEVNFKTQWLVR